MADFANIVPMHPTNDDGKPIANKYEERYCDDIKHMALAGEFPETWCATIGVTLATLYNWAHKHPEFGQAMREAWAILASYWTKQAAKAATSGSGVVSPTILARILERRFPHIWGPNAHKLHEDGFEAFMQSASTSSEAKTVQEIDGDDGLLEESELPTTEQQLVRRLAELRQEDEDLGGG